MTELICGACRGRMRVVDPSETVVCPHCGALVPPQAPPAEPPSTTLEVEDDPAHMADAGQDTVSLRLGEHTRLDSTNPTFVGDSATAVDDVSNSAGTRSSEFIDPRSTLAEFDFVPPEVDDRAHESEPAQEFGVEPGAFPSFDPGFVGESNAADPNFLETNDHLAAFTQIASSTETAGPEGQIARTENSPSSSSERVSQGASPRGVSRLAFMLVLSYASAMTLAYVYQYIDRQKNPGTLDLPDLVPPSQITNSKKDVSSRLIQTRPEENAVPAANVLTIGQSRQYGSIRVTPLRVIRGPVEFTFYKPEENQTKDPEGPVLKLYLRFENVSADQEFIPLDSTLVYSKFAIQDKNAIRKTPEPYNPHNFVSRVSDRGVRAKHAYALDLQVNGAWLVKDQHLDEDLAPGQALETFIPTTAEDLESLEGDLVWRFHFRKGYNRTSGRGVTTLIEVLFKSSDIIDETASGTTPDPDHPADQKSTAKDA